MNHSNILFDCSRDQDSIYFLFQKFKVIPVVAPPYMADCAAAAKLPAATPPAVKPATPSASGAATTL